jgi:hypothetical protein
MSVDRPVASAPAFGACRPSFGAVPWNKIAFTVAEVVSQTV